MQEKLKFIKASGSAIELGKTIGIQFKREINLHVNKYKHLLNDNAILCKLEKIQKNLEKIFPKYLKEIYGRAQGALVNEKLYLLTMCAEILNEGVGCTTILYKRKDGTLVLAHNEDDTYKVNSACITKCMLEKEWFITYDYINMPFGNAFSFNSHGIVKTINFCYNNTIREEGVPRYFVQRHISEAKSLNDFINRCNIDNRASGFHAIALDVHENKAISVECDYKNISVKELNDFYVHTNHFVHKNIEYNHKEVPKESTSFFRLEKASQLLKKSIEKKGDNISLKDFMSILNYRGKGYEDSILALKNDPNFTCARFGIDTAQNEKVLLQFFNTKELFYKNYNCIE
ncbi:C45 family autoproteolytic acyltransferase/hydolase [Clostridium rectalis]|uniref:C45 family autoproteolytic acyltransferase/hydolase n=1 Tax=Clostridium rectalis TaxID=2040295 RepID=UPI000F63F4CF|nr:C45 family autoproteolytic acyltransferase/hydolase [Clostridium rectalis]